MNIMHMARMIRAAALACKGNWSLGNGLGAVVSDDDDGIGDDRERAAYGGTLVGESMQPSTRLFLILAQPRHLEQIVEELERLHGIQRQLYPLRKALRKIADGQRSSEFAQYALYADYWRQKIAHAEPPSFEEWKMQLARDQKESNG